ncbi:MAG: hypothetical protein JNL50_06965 [Phycisphaerae bacterium]|nr:hypothetical protein [Phycisphaerae bacterium]
MPNSNNRNEFGKPSPAATDPTQSAAWWLGLSIAALLCFVLVVNGTSSKPFNVVTGLGILGLVVVWALFLLSLLLRRTGVSALEQRIESLTAMVEQLSQQGSLSDDARRVINRARERELLRRAIEEDMGREDWDAAMVLVKELADRFGYRADAEEFRQRITTARAETLDRRYREAVSVLDGLIMQRRWDSAIAEADKIARLFPEVSRVTTLRPRVEDARGLYKADVERRFLEATRDGDVDTAMKLLAELDAYLTESEAAPYKEVARGVIGKARDNLGAAFKLAVYNKRWVEAADLGDKIIGQFPNSRMAVEVRSLIDGIRTKAAAWQR